MLHIFLDNLFLLFENNKIRYVILRNYQSLPDFLDKGSDIDFLIDLESYKNIEKTLRSIPNLIILISVNRLYVKEFICSFNGVLCLKLDFHPYEQWKGAIYLTNDDVLNQREKYKNFYIPSRFHQGIISLFSSMLHGGFIKLRYANSIKTSFSDNEDKIRTQHKKYGAKSIEALIRYSKNQIREDELIKYRKYILSNICFYNIKTNFIGFLNRLYVYIKDEIKLRIKPKGLFLGFVGVDGSGKSTVIDKLIENVTNIVRDDRVVVYHLFPGSIRKNDFSVNPYSKREYSLIIGFLKEIYLLSKYWLNTFKLINTLSRTKMVIMDRLNYDIIVDPKRFRIKKLFLKEFFNRLIYSADVVFYCKADPLTIFNRKSELSLDEIERQQLILSEFLIKNKNWIEINTNDPNPYSAANQVIVAVARFLIKREN